MGRRPYFLRLAKVIVAFVLCMSCSKISAATNIEQWRGNNYAFTHVTNVTHHTGFVFISLSATAQIKIVKGVVGVEIYGRHTTHQIQHGHEGFDGEEISKSVLITTLAPGETLNPRDSKFAPCLSNGTPKPLVMSLSPRSTLTEVVASRRGLEAYRLIAWGGLRLEELAALK